MNLYFGSTHERFLYGHYLAILSAIKTQHVEKVILVYTVLPSSSNPYFNLIKDKIQILQFNPVNFPMLSSLSEYNQAATIKDYIEWITLYENGGIFMDLDTFSIKDMSNLLGNWDTVTTPALLPTTISNNELYEAAIVIAKKNSIIIKETLSYTLQALGNSSSKYTSTGPMALTKAVCNHKNIVGTAGIDSFGPRIRRAASLFNGVALSNVYIPAWLNINIPINTYALHLFASSSAFNNIDKNYIASSESMYARAVKSVLIEKEWNM